MGQKQKKEKTEGATGLGRITRELTKKMESNDSPELPDMKHPSSLRALFGEVYVK